MQNIHEAMDPAVAEFKAGISDMQAAFDEAAALMETDWTGVWGKIQSDAADATAFDAIRQQAASIEDLVRGGAPAGGIGLGDQDEISEWSEKYQDLTETVRDQIEANREMARVHGESRDIVDSLRASLKAKEEIAKLDIADTAERIKKTQELTSVYKELYDTEGLLADLEEGKKLTLQYDPIAKYADDMKNLARLSEQGIISTETFGAAARDLQEQFSQAYSEILIKSREWSAGAAVALRDYVKEATDAAKNFYTVFSNAFSRLVDEFVRLFTELKFDINSLLQSIQADITRAFVRQNITGPLAQSLGLQMGPQALFTGPGGMTGMDMFGGMMSSGGLMGSGMISGGGGGSGGFLGGLGSLFSGLFGGGLFGGFRAEGGEAQSSKTYIVGERGPEIFIPREPGTILPNNWLLKNFPAAAEIMRVITRNPRIIDKAKSPVERFQAIIPKPWFLANAPAAADRIRDTVSRFAEIRTERLIETAIGQAIQPEHRAAGGTVYPAIPYEVGERGPEIFLPSRFQDVKPRDNETSPNTRKSGKASRGQVFGDVHININAPMDEAQARRSGSQIAAELYQLQIERRRNF